MSNIKFDGGQPSKREDVSTQFYRQLLRVHPVFIACSAAVVYGSWSAFVNSEYGVSVAVRAGLGQASYAFLSTWIVTATAINVRALMGGGVLSYLSSFGCAFAVMLVIPILIHFLLGTPDILEAIIPGLVWGSFYICFILFTESRKVKNS